MWPLDYPKPVIVRFSDFKSNEYANLLGGSLYEPKEENPMLGYRGASRYLSESFRSAFELECQAIYRVREDMGLKNTQIMVPSDHPDFARWLVEEGISSLSLSPDSLIDTWLYLTGSRSS